MDLGAAPARRRWLFPIAAAVLALAAFACTFTQVFDYDLFWHLASGQWMLQHGRVLGTDPFSVDPLPVWVNVHWLFQVIVAALHAAGGFAALSSLKAALAVATILVLALALRRHVPAGWLVLSGLAAIFVMETRLRVRPESFSILFLALTIAAVEHIRRGGSPKGLWLLVPLMAVWVNMQGLYILGPAIFWSAGAGAVLDGRLGRRTAAGALASKQATVPILAATAACLISPWPLEAAAQPLLLWTRISGQTAAFSQGVSEFLPTWQSPFYLWLLIGLGLAAIAACAANRRNLPAGHVLWLVAFGALALMARRNVALTGPVFGYLLALHGGAVIHRSSMRLSAPKAAGLGATFTAGAIVLALAYSAACATEWLFRVRGVHRRFGPGLYAPHYAIDLARRLGELPAAGDIFCEDWGDAGAFIHFGRGQVGRRLWMDGRLEAHTLDRYLSQGRLSQALRSPGSAATVKLPPSLRFFYVKALSGEHLSALSRSGRFRLWAADGTGAFFIRNDWPGEGPDVPDGPALSTADRPLLPDLTIDGVPLERPRWWRRNPPSPYYGPGVMFLWLGRQDPGTVDRADLHRRRCMVLACRYLAAAAADSITDRTAAIGMLAQAHQQRALQEDITCTGTVPIDYHSARALYLYRQLDLTDLADENTRQFAEQHVDALVRARRLDAAERAAAALIHRLPSNTPAVQRLRCKALHASLVAAVELSRRTVAEAAPKDQPARAAFLASPQAGLADRAILELRAAPPTAAAKLLLGDLLHNAGQTAAAQAAYDDAARLDAAFADAVALRRLIRQMVETGLPSEPGAVLSPGAMLPSAEACEPASPATILARPTPVGRTAAMRPWPAHPTAEAPSLVASEAYYQALLLEQTGHYAQAADLLSGAHSADPQLAILLDRLRAAVAR